MYNLESMSREKRTKFLEEHCKLIDRGFFPKKEQVGSGNGNRQRRIMNKDDCQDIVREVVTAIYDSAYNADNDNMEK